jgi:hypothetical protein
MLERGAFYAVILERSEGSPHFVLVVAVAVACFTSSSWSEAKDPVFRRCCFKNAFDAHSRILIAPPHTGQESKKK